MLSLLVIIVEAVVSMSRLQRKCQKASYLCAFFNMTLLLFRLSFVFFLIVTLTVIFLLSCSLMMHK